MSAARLTGAAEAARETFSIHGYPAAQQRYDAWIAQLKRILDPGDFQRARAEGRAMTLAQPCEYALLAALGVEAAIHPLRSPSETELPTLNG